ncbi:hypothetical protein FA95DRAFT_348827 [Auriscalpium vulgare]|uniref:Uncharacterized protein n=1 Tax=Auriscalpium vulgare TaxID=40419 RepID=A0ACB8RIN8_9AGAM|nr:hypothetical protein FA95DRAFT_348827 [Auriscalpium vulgare]
MQEGRYITFVCDVTSFRGDAYRVADTIDRQAQCCWETVDAGKARQVLERGPDNVAPQLFRDALAGLPT